MKDYIRINCKDNVAVALKELVLGTLIKIEDENIILKETIPAGHKFALKNIMKSNTIIKYGHPIGFAKTDILAGTWIHTHNIQTTLGDILEYSYNPCFTDKKTSEKSYFYGYRRLNNKVGVRNEIWIIPTVGCVNSIASALEKEAAAMLRNNIDGIWAFPHPYGCSQMGEDQENTRQILADLINHPNAGGVLVLGLGCENSNIAELKTYIGNYDERRVKFLQCQDVEDEMNVGKTLISELISYAGKCRREKISAEELIIGMKCGGSDGLSGITANPIVGAFSDILISKGGSTILTEVPEMFGAEILLMNRCRDKETFQKTVAMINDVKQYFTDHNQVIYENPSPGNKKGGISTLEDKSLGCTQKSGNAPVSDVLAYGEVVQKTGLNLLNAPGNDLVASTALAASGAHIILFTTGRGTPFAAPVPTLKLSSNSSLFENKRNWIDFDCGRLLELENDKSLENDISIVNENTGVTTLAEELFEYVLEVASGKNVKSELAGFHDMAIFKQGVTL